MAEDKKQAHGRFPQQLILSAPAWSGLSNYAKAVLMVFVVRVNKDRECWLGRKKIGILAGLSKLDYVDAGIRELVALGFVIKHNRTHPELGKDTNIYELKLDWENQIFGRMPAWIIQEGVWAKLSSKAKATLVVIQALCQGNETVSEKLEVIRVLTGIKKVDTVSKALDELVEAKLLEVESRKPLPNVYKPL